MEGLKMVSKKKKKAKENPLRKRILIAAVIVVLVVIGILFIDQINGIHITEANEKVKELRKIPEAVMKIQAKIGKENVKKNEKGFWEADYGDGIKMVYIPEGEFSMGTDKGDSDEKPVHKVYLDGYWMGKTEVTVGQFRLFVEAKGYKTDAEKSGWAYTCTGDKWEQKEDINWKNPGFKQEDNHPVVCISWNDAKSFCDWLSNKRGLSFKLPTEAQWEKAARGTTNSKYPWGDHDPYYNGKWYANYRAHGSWEKRGEDSFEFSAPVGSYPQGASPYGLLDMAGNVWEWCRDWFGSDYYNKSPGRNPPGPGIGIRRVMRGGSWSSYASYLLCAVRNSVTPSYRGFNLGFRLCQDKR
jgi:formylglycine-generating enzyme required for sulfatase activity